MGNWQDFEGILSVAQIFSQPELNGRMRALNLLKKSAESLLSGLAEKNIATKNQDYITSEKRDKYIALLSEQEVCFFATMFNDYW